MKKAAAILMALLMGVPALAQPVCAMACGGTSTTESVSCCCAPKVAPADGNASIGATPCCPSDAPRADLGKPDSAVRAGLGADLAPGARPAASGPALPAAPDAQSSAGAGFPVETGGVRSTGPPIFLAHSSLRL